MLNLNAKPRVWITHEETGARFEIQPITPRDTQRLQKQAKDKSGEIDYVTYNGLLVEFAVLDWEFVGGPDGPLPPTPSAEYKGSGPPPVPGNKYRLGEKFQSIANFIHLKAIDVKLFVDEVEEAKNG
ncbi:MAG: hypothetical protein HY847_01275 [Betaproteobacteria bacterium]|nr:hypothetical protein [Betaproteobacteria bacterium]